MGNSSISGTEEEVAMKETKTNRKVKGKPEVPQFHTQWEESTKTHTVANRSKRLRTERPREQATKALVLIRKNLVNNRCLTKWTER